jgi:hypothetical protein
MAHINTVQNGIYTSLAFLPTAYALTAVDTQSEIVALMAATSPTEITNIRDFPEFGNPANIVNVPVYGSPTSTQVAGQADLNTMEFTLNYIPDQFETQVTHARVGDGNLYAFQIALCNKRPSTFKQVATTGIASGTTLNSVFNFSGKFESLTVTPSLTDALQAKLTLSMATPMFGPATYA